MAYDRESVLEQYPSEITDILKATTADPKDKGARMKVATTLARVLSFTKRRTGEDRTPQDTEVYKLAATIRQARSREQFDSLIQQSVPKAKANILEKYNLVWDLPWSTEQEQVRKPRRRRAKKAEVSEAVPDIGARIDALPTGQEQEQVRKPRRRRAKKAEVSEAVPDIGARIDALEQAVSGIGSQLSDLKAKIESSGTKKLVRQLDEVLQKLKAHQHDREDGRAYILEKKEL
jgi:hypothetical protein